MAQKDTHHPANGHVSPHYESGLPLDSAIRIVEVDENGLMEMLLRLRGSEKYIADLAAKLEVSAQHLGDVLAGRKSFGAKLLKAMGVVRVRQIYDVEIVMDEGIDE
jgi:hypothetical protein